jgi:hypothetical protein
VFLSEYCGDQMKEDEISGTCATYWEKRNAYTGLVGKPEEKTPVGRPRRRWDNNIKSYLKEMGSLGAKWICLAQDTDKWQAFVSTVMNLGVL